MNGLNGMPAAGNWVTLILVLGGIALAVYLVVKFGFAFLEWAQEYWQNHGWWTLLHVGLVLFVALPLIGLGWAKREWLWTQGLANWKQIAGFAITVIAPT